LRLPFRSCMAYVKIRSKPCHLTLVVFGGSRRTAI
jgi:hypothetical protein